MARTEPELTDAQWAALAPLLPPQRPATGRPNLKVLMALLDILDCRMDELIEPVAARASRTKKKAVGQTPEPTPGIGDFRPKRARIVPDSSS